MIQLEELKKYDEVALDLQAEIAALEFKEPRNEDCKKKWIERRLALPIVPLVKEFQKNINSLPSDLLDRYLKLAHHGALRLKERFSEYEDRLSGDITKHPESKHIEQLRILVNLCQISLQAFIDGLIQFNKINNTPIGKGEDAAEPIFTPIRLTNACKKNEIPTYFYELLEQNKITSPSKANIIRVLQSFLRDEDGKELSKSYLDEIFNKTKPQSRSAKVLGDISDEQRKLKSKRPK